MSLNAEQQALLTAINQGRAQVGAPQLSISPILMQAAGWMANDLAQKNYLSHTDSLGRTIPQRLSAFGYNTVTNAIGETIAAGVATGSGVYQQWYTGCDPDTTGTCTYAHRTVMLNPAYNYIGIGTGTNPNSTYGTYWVAYYGSVLGSTPTTTTTTPVSPTTTTIPQQVQQTPTTTQPTTTTYPNTAVSSTSSGLTLSGNQGQTTPSANTYGTYGLSGTYGFGGMNKARPT